VSDDSLNGSTIDIQIEIKPDMDRLHAEIRWVVVFSTR